ncbi:MAG TPA: replication-associated recombination protein A [Ktedonobacterales bacterium]|nr:replication-associated recombination protein A [Ktedonobacterales bacterium]
MSDDQVQASLFGDDAAPGSATEARRSSRGGQSLGRSQSGGSLPEHDDTPAHAQPLAQRMRPRTLDEVVGQQHLLAPGRALRRSIESDHTPSMILWGPPGSGKTTIASVIAQTTQARFVPLSAVTAGVADLRRVVDDAAKLLRATGRRTILFIDEIHRFSKSQQDAILPHVERGTVTLIGATTENPSFEVNAALLSRSRVYTLHALSDQDILGLLRRALSDERQGLGDERLNVTDDALTYIANMANGDARSALNLLELGASVSQSQPDGARLLDLPMVEDAAQHRALLYDKGGEEHYNLISALHKSLRGSDPDAAVYWLARMLEAGEDPLYVARRLVRFATEDVGLADPHALALCMAAQQAVHFIGVPEGALALAEAAIYLATAPKSNAVYRAYGAASEDVRATRNDPVPLHLRNAPTRLMSEQDYGKGYIYAHDRYSGAPDPEDPSRPPPQRLQDYLPEPLARRAYYQPGEQGAEASIAAWLRRRREATSPDAPSASKPGD